MSSKQEELLVDFMSSKESGATNTTVSTRTVAATASKTQHETPSSCSSETNNNKASTESTNSSITTTTLAWSSSRSGGTRKSKRTMCVRCHRPAPQACICEALPAEPIALTNTRILILQHPHEARRKNRSVPLVQLALKDDDSSCIAAVGRRLGDQVDAKMMDIINNEQEPLLLLYPGPNAVSLQDAMKQLKERLSGDDKVNGDSLRKVNVLVLDGTWKYAKEMNQKNEYPERMIQIQLDPVKDIPDFTPARFEIRAPPAPNYVSTAECIAWVVSQLEERNNDLYQILLKPLDCMVRKWKSFASGNNKRAAANETNHDTKDGAARSVKHAKRCLESNI